MSDSRPPDQETTAEWLERIRKIPGVRIVHNPSPNPWVPPDDVRVNPGVTVQDILGWDDEDDPET